MAARKDSTVSDGGEKEVCGECKKVVGRNERGVMCEQCELWFHCKCEKLHEDTYKLMGQEKIHFYCGRCDKAVGKLLKAITSLQIRQDQMEEDLSTIKMEIKEVKNEMVEKLEGKVTKVEEELNQRGSNGLVRMGDMEKEFIKIRFDLKELRRGKVEASGVIQLPTQEIDKLHGEMDKMRKVMESRINESVQHVKEDVEESMEIERRKGNVVIHGVPELDAEKDMEQVLDIFGKGLHLDFERHVEKMHRIGKLVEGRPRPIKVMLKTAVDGKKEILSRAKQLKEYTEYKRIFISPDLTRKQQEKDKELRQNLKRIRESGESEARIRFGKIVKNGRGGREEVLYPIEQN